MGLLGTAMDAALCVAAMCTVVLHAVALLAGALEVIARRFWKALP